MRVPPIILVGVAALGILLTLGVVLANMDTTGRYYLVAVGGAAGTGLFLASWNEL